MKAIFLLLVLLINLTTACDNTNNININENTLHKIIFIDLDNFDINLTKQIKRNTNTIEIVFLDQIKISHLPTRIQILLDSIHSNGGEVDLNQSSNELAPGAHPFISIASTLLTITQNIRVKPEFKYDTQNYNAKLNLTKNENGLFIESLFLIRK